MITRAPDLPRSPWQRFYATLLARRRARARARRLASPVISVGNVHWGGSGKTPVTAAIARLLRDRDLRVAILSRGHGRSSRGPVLVSRGQGPLVPVAASGDEPALHASLEGVAVAVAERRFDAGNLVLAEGPVDVFLLDDGFSHVDLARDLELLVFPSSDPWAGGRLLPSGRLREPLSAVRTADAALLTGLDPGSEHGESWLQAFQRDIGRHGYGGPCFGVSASTQVTLGDQPQTRLRALLVTGVARPAAVRRSAEIAGADRIEIVDHLIFRDHHRYPERSRQRIRDAAERLGADVVLVTGKDKVKLVELELPEGCRLRELEHRAELPDAFAQWLGERLKSLLPA